MAVCCESHDGYFGMIHPGIGKGPLRDEAGIYAFFEVALG
jgi:hypothetical protein